MTEATELMEGHLIQRERVPGSAIQTRQVLYFRGDKVIKLLQERNDHLQQISDQLKKAVEKHRRVAAFVRSIADQQPDECKDQDLCESARELLASLKEDQP